MIIGLHQVLGLLSLLPWATWEMLRPGRSRRWVGRGTGVSINTSFGGAGIQTLVGLLEAER